MYVLGARRHVRSGLHPSQCGMHLVRASRILSVDGLTQAPEHCSKMSASPPLRFLHCRCFFGGHVYASLVFSASLVPCLSSSSYLPVLAPVLVLVLVPALVLVLVLVRSFVFVLVLVLVLVLVFVLVLVLVLALVLVLVPVLVLVLVHVSVLLLLLVCVCMLVRVQPL